MDTNRLKRLRLRVEVNDPLYGGLKKMKLRGKDLQDIPREVFTFTDLQVLDLSPEREACLLYKVPEVPGNIRLLVNLQVLMLDTNDLMALPDEICQLKTLQRLSLSNNQLTSLPSDFSQLTSLTSLHAANNKFTSFPTCLCSIVSLAFLDLSDNNITDIPAQISQLSNLQSLLMFVNQLTSLPEEICQLANLRCLWLGNNNIHRLPRNFASLKLLDWGRNAHTASTSIDGNPLQDPPVSVCKQGVKAIERYFKSTEEHDY